VLRNLIADFDLTLALSGKRSVNEKPRVVEKSGEVT